MNDHGCQRNARIVGGLANGLKCGFGRDGINFRLRIAHRPGVSRPQFAERMLT